MEAINILLFSLLFILSIHAKIDPYSFLHIIPNPDGSITRLNQFYPTLPPNSTTTLSFSKDVPLDPDNNTRIRIYIPSGLAPGKLLPVVVFVHGGGFIVMSSATPKFDSFCSAAASRLAAVVVSVEYRLAPEHRLLAAYDDVLEALYWVKQRRDEWVREYADLSRCVVVGESAGGNAAYAVGLRASGLTDDLKPLIVRGLVLVQPFFGGVRRTGSEVRLVNDSVVPLVVSDLLWELALPGGATRDHVYCNPTAGGGSGRVAGLKEMGWWVGVVGCDGDPLFDRQVEVVKLLKKHGVNVKYDLSRGGYHGIFTDQPEKVNEVLQLMKDVLLASSMD